MHREGPDLWHGPELAAHLVGEGSGADGQVDKWAGNTSCAVHTGFNNALEARGMGEERISVSFLKYTSESPMRLSSCGLAVMCSQNGSATK